MLFRYLLKNIEKISDLEIPGIEAQLKMAPKERYDSIQNVFSLEDNAKKAAILMLIYPKNDLAHLLLIVRNSYPGVHSSQIAFPGGKVENFDKSYEETALRETFEEIGVSQQWIQVYKSFTPVYIPPSNFYVYPYLGIAEKEVNFIKNEAEVADLIELPLSKLLDESIVSYMTIETSYAKSIKTPVFSIDNNVIWGATAMMLSELKEALKLIL
ncbi:NUDIX hydrolase [Flavobacterium aciduliphilum]|uniref:NUDIX domain-containing protein n=1 Tax=Flavobacterium aciduliphilum TaxID=1101402 RepID=A0A328YA42_9FLAO|nr:CoA pyrophosphatase [Flavobacterium aciduliphilum]RAR70878.1 NUDIX domain-containing protein [Flavobacterium aciduliphilum]